MLANRNHYHVEREEKWVEDEMGTESLRVWLHNTRKSTEWLTVWITGRWTDSFRRNCQMEPIVSNGRSAFEIRSIFSSGAGAFDFPSHTTPASLKKFRKESDANENRAELSLSQSKARYVGTKAFRGKRVPFRSQSKQFQLFAKRRYSLNWTSSALIRRSVWIAMVSLNNLTQFLALTRFIMPR